LAYNNSIKLLTAFAETYTRCGFSIIARVNAPVIEKLYLKGEYLLA